MISIEEFYNKDAIEKLEEEILSGHSVILSGGSGVGKTSGVYVIAEKHNMIVIEKNASDERTKENLQSILDLAKNRTFGKEIIILLDEADGIDDYDIVRKILGGTRHSVVMTVNDEWKVPEDIKSSCTKIKFRPIPLTEIVKEARKLKNPIFKGLVGNDIRSGMLSAQYGGDGYHEIDDFKITEDVLSKGILHDEFNDDHYVWLLDNISRFYIGLDILKVMDQLALSSRFKRPDLTEYNHQLLELLPSGRGRVVFPHYLKKLKAYKEKKRKEKKVGA